MNEDFLHGHTDAHSRALAINRHRAEQLLVPQDARAAIDAKRFVSTRNQKQKTHVRVGENVPHTVHPLVSWSIRNDEMGVVDHADETGCVTLR